MRGARGARAGPETARTMVGTMLDTGGGALAKNISKQTREVLPRASRARRYGIDCESELRWHAKEPGGDYKQKLLIKNVSNQVWFLLVPRVRAPNRLPLAARTAAVSGGKGGISPAPDGVRRAHKRACSRALLLCSMLVLLFPMVFL